jgi:hypothetical protein
MNKQDALEKLELEVGASQQAIKQQYQEFYNEFKMRITNAPTTHQKTLYQKKLKELEDAYVLLTGHNTEDTDAELPGMAPTEGFSTQNTSISNKLSKAQALKLLGFNEPFTKDILENAYRAKKRDCEQAIKSALDEDVEKSNKRVLTKIQQAYTVLTPLAQEPIAKPPKPKETKKSVSPIIWIVLAAVIVGAGLFIWQPWKENIDPEIEKQFTTLKAQADLLATQKNWSEALEKYKAAYNLEAQPEVQDSIASMNKQLEEFANAEETKAWEAAKTANTIESYKAYLSNYTESKYKIEANSTIAAIKNAQSNATAIKKQEAKQLAQQKKKAKLELEAQQLLDQKKLEEQKKLDLEAKKLADEKKLEQKEKQLMEERQIQIDHLKRQKENEEQKRQEEMRRYDAAIKRQRMQGGY